MNLYLRFLYKKKFSRRVIISRSEFSLSMSRRAIHVTRVSQGRVASVGACNEIQITSLVSVYHRNDASARHYSAGRFVHKLM